jgi:heme oxygenase
MRIAKRQDGSLQKDNIRSALRSHTANQHRKLDDAVGAFDTIEGYARFVRQSHSFRTATEEAIPPSVDWSVLPLAGLLANDLDDLGQRPDAQIPFPDAPADPAYWLGVAYVLEGSALGARLLVRRAAALGFSDTRGARHLAEQAETGSRWRDFQARLDAAPAATHGAMLAGAAAAFDFALTIYAANDR